MTPYTNEASKPESRSTTAFRMVASEGICSCIASVMSSLLYREADCATRAALSHSDTCVLIHWPPHCHDADLNRPFRACYLRKTRSGVDSRLRVAPRRWNPRLRSPSERPSAAYILSACFQMRPETDKRPTRLSHR